MRDSALKWLEKNVGIIATVVLVGLSFFVMFRVAFPVNMGNLGGTHSWLSGSTIKFVDYWLEEGAVNLNFTNYENPASVEFGSLEERDPYLSYPSGETFFVYMAARIMGKTSISVAFLHKFQLVMFLVEAILLASFVYYFMARTVKCKKETTKVGVAVSTAVLWMLMPTCAYYLTNIYYADQCVILWVMGLILIEYLLRTSKKEKKVGMKLLRAVVLYSGILVDYYFWFLAFLVFVAEIVEVFLKNKKGERKKEIISILLWFGIPVVLAVVTYFVQLTRTNNWVAILTDTFGERVVGEGQTSEWIMSSIGNNFVQAFSLDAGMINYLIIIMALVLVLGVVILIKKKKALLIFKEPGLSLIICNVLAIILQIFFFKQHSAIHEFSMMKVGWMVAMLPVLMTMVFGRVMEIKVEKFLPLFLVNCLVVLLTVGIPVSTEKFIKSRTEVTDSTLEYSIRENTGYNDVLFSYSKEIKENPPQALAISHKRVYKIDDVEAVMDKMAGLNEEAKMVLVIDGDADIGNKKSLGQERCLAKEGITRWKNERYRLVEIEDVNKCKVEVK